MRFCVMAVPSTVIPFAFVTDAGSIVLQMPRNRKRVTQKEKEMIEAYALSQNSSCFETVARVVLRLTL